MAPEIEKEETQEDFGWEDLTSTGDGRSDMSEASTPPEPKPTPVESQPQAAETPVETTPEPPAEGAPTETPVAEGAEQAAGETPEQTWTLDGGQTVTAADLAANPDLITQIVTRSNQTSNFQRLADEREQHRLQTEAENRRLLDQYTAWQMQQQQAAQQQAAPPPPQRPAGKELEGKYAAHLDQLVSDGRLTEDQRAEFGNVIAEYMFDHQSTMNVINQVVAAGGQRIAQLEQQLSGYVVPDLQHRQQQDVINMDYQVQQTVATSQGYESLADPNEWNRLKLFIAEKVNASPRDQNGRPTFDPVFDAPTMAQMYDAMTGAEIRAKLAAQKAAQEAAAKETATRAGGETTARASAPPQKQPSKLTPEDEAMDFHDPRFAAG